MGGFANQVLVLKRVGIQNWRMASTSNGIVHSASRRACSARGPGGGAPGTVRPAASVQWDRIGSSQALAGRPVVNRGRHALRRNCIAAWKPRHQGATSTAPLAVRPKIGTNRPGASDSVLDHVVTFGHGPDRGELRRAAGPAWS